MKFKTDENMPVQVAEILVRHGYDAINVIDQNLAGHPDLNVAQVCRTEQRALVTLDLDFADKRVYPPDQYAGLIVPRPSRQSIPAIERLAELMVQIPRQRTSRRTPVDRGGAEGADSRLTIIETYWFTVGV